MLKFSTLLGFVQLFVVLASITTVTTANASSETIAFCSDRDGDDPEIYMMDIDGTNLLRLTDNISIEHGLSCSPDGRWIAFVSDREGNDEIYIMKVDGSGLQRLTNNSADDYAPDWSRDGSKIAFTSERDGDKEIFVMNSDGSELQQLTYNNDADNTPGWSPNGSFIVFHSDSSGFVDIWVMNADGSSKQNLTNDAAPDYMPDCSPDGSKIVFESTRHGPLELYTMNADGSNIQRLTYDYSDNHSPDWSPDGSQIVYMSMQGVNYEVMVIGSDGSGLQNLTNHSAFDSDTAWRPAVLADSLKGGGTGVLAYTYQPISGPEVHQIYTIRLEGTENHKIIDAPYGLNHHEWSPNGRRFAGVGYVDQWTWSIHVFNADGTGLTRLTTEFAVWDNEPAWSPDSLTIAWGRIYPNQNYRVELWMMNADGTNQHTIDVAGDGVSWSPDGTRLAYHDAMSGANIWTCNTDGTDEQQLTDLPTNDLMADWSPDGSRIVFSSDRDGNFELYVMDVNGDNQRRLTFNTVADDGARWSPDGSLIAYSSGPYLEWEVYVMDSTGANIRRITHSPPGITAINPDWQPGDSTTVPVFLTGLSFVQESASIKFFWNVSETAAPEDFRLLADDGEGKRRVPIYAAGHTNFEAVDDHPSLRAGGSFEYHLFVLRDDGQWDLLRTEIVKIEPPQSAASLLGVYPNPFNPQANISFAVNFPEIVRIDIHDVTGRIVKKITEKEYNAGDFTLYWDGRDDKGREVASGIYLLRFQAGKNKEVRKLALIR